MSEIMELKEEIKESERIIRQLDKEIAGLKSKIKSEKNSPLLKEINELERRHIINLVDIDDYKSQLNEIQNNLNSQKLEIDALQKENEKLKAKKKRNKNRNKSPIKKIKGIDDLTNSFGLKKIVKKKEKNEEDAKIEEDKREEEDKKKEFEKLKNLLKENEVLFQKLKKEISSYYEQIKNHKNFTASYRNCIESLNDQIESFKQELKISIVGRVNFNYSKNIDITVNQLSNDMDKIKNILNKINRNLVIIKNRIINEGENILNDIDFAFSEINENKILNYGFLLNRMDLILIKIEDLKELCEILKKDLSIISNKRNDIEKKIKEININIEKLMSNYKEGKKKLNDDLYETIRKRGKNIFNSIDKNLRKEKHDKIDEENEEICDSMVEENYDDTEDTLVKIKDYGKNIDMFKSEALFKKRNEKKENRSKIPKIIRKNWNEVCYIYDDYDIHDVNFEIKAIGLDPLCYFDSFSDNFIRGKYIEILDFEINGKRSKYTYENYGLEFSINLKNLEKAKIHLKYKKRPNFDNMDENEKSVYLYYRRTFYGLRENLEGQMGKFRIILKENFEIISFKEDFFIRNKENKKEKEYIWGGKIPSGGKRTLTTLSKKEAIWSICYNVFIKSLKGNLRYNTLQVPLAFVGGNNDIVKIDYISPQTNDIVVDQENRKFVIKYENTEYKEGNFKLIGQIKNKCKGEWIVDLSDELIEKQIPIEDKRDKKKLAKIARKIIDEYDRNNEKNILSFMDFSKIGKWVYENIEYDINYIGRKDMTAIDIYNQRVGVCMHKTRLANALLYSLGYKVIYASGFTCSRGPRFEGNGGHAWSLINVKDKWYPFDATWNILLGKLPVCHIFFNFFSKKIIQNEKEHASLASVNKKYTIEYIN